MYRYRGTVSCYYIQLSFYMKSIQVPLIVRITLVRMIVVVGFRLTIHYFHRYNFRENFKFLYSKLCNKIIILV